MFAMNAKSLLWNMLLVTHAYDFLFTSIPFIRPNWSKYSWRYFMEKWCPISKDIHVEQFYSCVRTLYSGLEDLEEAQSLSTRSSTFPHPFINSTNRETRFTLMYLGTGSKNKVVSPKSSNFFVIRACPTTGRMEILMQCLHQGVSYLHS